MDDDETIDLFSGQVGSTNNYIPFSNKDSISTAKYLNETIGNVIGDILDQCSRDAPPDPILYLAELLARHAGILSSSDSYVSICLIRISYIDATHHPL